MRNSIDKEAYKLLFGILIFFGAVLALVSIMLYIDLKGFAPLTRNVSVTLFFMLLGLALWLRSDYLKLYNLNSYKVQRVPLWIGASIFLFASLFFNIL